MVPRLVRRRLLPALACEEPIGADARHAAVLARRIVAPSGLRHALCGAQQHSSREDLRRLRLPCRGRRELRAAAPFVAPPVVQKSTDTVWPGPTSTVRSRP